MEEFHARSFSRHGFSKETRLDTRIKTHYFGVNTLLFIFRCSARKIRDLLRLMKGFIVVENFYEHVCCKEKLLKDYKV